MSADALRQFVVDVAAMGCRIIHLDGGTCRDRMESARAHQRDGTQPDRGPRWGSEGDTGRWRDKIAGGHGMCRACRAAVLLDGEYLPPTPGDRYAA